MRKYYAIYKSDNNGYTNVLSKIIIYIQILLDRLKNHNINYQNYTHDALFAVEQANQTDNQIPAIHTKNLFVKNKKGQFAMIKLLANKKLNSKLFRNQTAFGDFSFSSAEELFTQIQIKPGSVGIFALINNPDIGLFIDEDIWTGDLVGRHPNDNTATTVINHQGLVSYLKYLQINFAIIKL